MRGNKTKGRFAFAGFVLLALFTLALAAPVATAWAQGEGGGHHGGEANLVLPDLNSVTFLGGVTGHNLLLFGLVICLLATMVCVWWSFYKMRIVEDQTRA